MKLYNFPSWRSLASMWLFCSIVIRLKALDCNPSDHPPDQKLIVDCDVISSGAFVLNNMPAGVTETVNLQNGGKVAGSSFILPFRTEEIPKGNVGKVINIKLFSPSSLGEASDWSLPLKEHLLLFLKKDPNADFYYLIDPRSGWLVTKDSNLNSGSPSPAQAVVKEIVNFLQWRSANGSSSFKYFTAASSASDKESMTYSSDDPVTYRALQTGRILGLADKDFQDVVEKFVNASGREGALARTIEISAGRFSSALSRLKDYDQGKIQGDERLAFPFELANGIYGASNVSALVPLVSEALSSPDSQVRSNVARALIKKHASDNKMYPILVKSLDDPNPEIQHLAMACIFYMSGSNKIYYPKQEIHLPGYKDFLVNQSTYIAQYKAWWEKHKASLQ